MKKTTEKDKAEEAENEEAETIAEEDENDPCMHHKHSKAPAKGQQKGRQDSTNTGKHEPDPGDERKIENRRVHEPITDGNTNPAGKAEIAKQEEKPEQKRLRQKHQHEENEHRKRRRDATVPDSRPSG